ncbi:MAG: hypothetical protein HY066_13910 [Betaproteobacteria bacterium]|nr:hypothetical protein [Betaproteobacteria bacterium]
MKSRYSALVLIALLAACSGIPLRSLPRLMQFQNELLNANPAEFMFAVQMDARMTPPAGAVPTLQLIIRPKEPGAFEAIDKKLPMRFTATSAGALGLAAAPADRRWLIYSFPAESQAELLRIQGQFKRIQAREQGKGGSLSVGISQEGLAVSDPAYANTRWESWLQTSRRDGFFELWSGSVAELLKQAKSGEASRVQKSN